MAESEIVTIPHIRRVIYDNYANFPTTDLAIGDLAYAKDHKVLYRWSGAAWQAITTPSFVSDGAYTGNDAVNRSIAHGLGGAPKFVFIGAVSPSEGNLAFARGDIMTVEHQQYAYFNVVGNMNDTYFFVGIATYPGRAMNANGVVYFWMAIR